MALKPTVNCKNGTWRAHINFFDEEVPCEPKWRNWFASYTEFQKHYAKIAQETGCEMRTLQVVRWSWQSGVRQSGDRPSQRLEACSRDSFLTIQTNTKEHNVTWWDCVDVISSSGYYPIEDWERQLDRIEAVAAKYQKPFFFCGGGLHVCRRL